MKGNNQSSNATYFRQLDVRLGRWMSPDVITQPWQSPYCSMDNNPVALVDPSGNNAKNNGFRKSKYKFTKGGVRQKAPSNVYSAPAAGSAINSAIAAVTAGVPPPDGWRLFGFRLPEFYREYDINPITDEVKPGKLKFRWSHTYYEIWIVPPPDVNYGDINLFGWFPTIEFEWEKRVEVWENIIKNEYLYQKKPGEEKGPTWERHFEPNKYRIKIRFRSK